MIDFCVAHNLKILSVAIHKREKIEFVINGCYKDIIASFLSHFDLFYQFTDVCTKFPQYKENDWYFLDVSFTTDNQHEPKETIHR